ncbi:hypothetical protein D9M68_640400 [compost metagenome]
MAAPDKCCEKQDSVDPAGNDLGRGDAACAEPRKQSERQRDVHNDGDGSEDHRRARILAREETGNEGLDQDESRQAETVNRQDVTDDDGRFRRELAALEEQPNDRLGHDQKCCCRRQRQEQRELDRAVLQVRRFVDIAGTQRPGKFRQEHGCHRDADDAERKLVDAVRIDQRRDRAFARRSDIGIDQEVDLGDTAGDRRRQG